EEFERCGADERAAAKSGPVQSRRESRGKVFVGDECAKRKAAGQRLGDGDDVRRRVEFLVRKAAPGAPEPALDFIGDQSGVMLRRKRAGARPESIADGEDAAFALNGLDD